MAGPSILTHNSVINMEIYDIIMLTVLVGAVVF